MFIDLEKAYQDDLLYYWCNSGGEICIPGANKWKTGTVDDLPPGAAVVYERFWSDGLGGARVYVATYNGEYGLAYGWDFNMTDTIERFGFYPQNADGQKMFHRAVRQTAEEYERARGGFVLYGENTDPLGDEIMLFVPLAELNKYPRLYKPSAERDKEFSGITRWLYAAVDKKIEAAIADEKRAMQIPAAEKLEKLTALLRDAVDTAENIRSKEDSIWDEDKEIVRFDIASLLDSLVGAKNLLSMQVLPQLLTADEEESIYRKVERKYRLRDAANHLGELFGIEDLDEDKEANPGAWQLFADTMGYAFDEACNLSSDYYCLDYLVEQFERRQDANVAVNDTWAVVVDEFVKKSSNRSEEGK